MYQDLKKVFSIAKQHRTHFEEEEKEEKQAAVVKLSRQHPNLHNNCEMNKGNGKNTIIWQKGNEDFYQIIYIQSSLINKKRGEKNPSAYDKNLLKIYHMRM